MQERKVNKMKKTKEEVLDQMYITASDLKILMPTMSIAKCRMYIEQIRLEMEQKNFFVPQTKPWLALTKLVRKKFGF